MKPIYKKYFRAVGFFWVGCLILFVFMYIVVLGPQRGSKRQIEERLAERRKVYESAVQASQEETRLKLMGEIERLRNELRTFVADKEDSSNLAFDIRRIAEEGKVESFSVKNRDMNGSTPLPNCDYIRENYIDISFSTGFNRFATLLSALERHQPVIFIDKFAIVRSGEGNVSHGVTMSLSFFCLKQAGQLAQNR